MLPPELLLQTLELFCIGEAKQLDTYNDANVRAFELVEPYEARQSADGAF